MTVSNAHTHLADAVPPQRVTLTLNGVEQSLTLRRFSLTASTSLSPGTLLSLRRKLGLLRKRRPGRLPW